MTGSSWFRRASSVRSRPNWSSSARVVEQALDLRANLLQRRAEVFEDVRRDPFAFDQQPKQQVLGADIVVAHPACLFEGDLDHLLDARRRDDLLDDDPLVPAQHGLDRLADLPDFHAEVVQDLGGQAFTLAKQAQEQVLGAYVAVVGSFCFFLGERQNLLGSLSKSFKRVQGLFLPGFLSPRWGQHLLQRLLWYPSVPPHLI